MMNKKDGYYELIAHEEPRTGGIAHDCIAYWSGGKWYYAGVDEGETHEEMLNDFTVGRCVMEDDSQLARA